LLDQIRNAANFGIKKAEADFAEVMDRVHSIIKTIEPHDSV
jgi:hypothetical protein